MEEKIFFKTSDNIKLCGIWSVPQKSIQKAIILAHGISVDKEEDGLFAPLTKKLVGSGYSVLRFDFRGHGESEGASVEATISGELVDLGAAYDEVKKRNFGKIGLLGASFGGGTSSIFATNMLKDLNFLCLWYPVLNYDHVFINPYLPWLKERIDVMKRELKSNGWTALINGNVFKIGKKLYDEMEKYFPYKELQKIKIPVVIIHGNKDTYVPYEDSVEYFKEIGSKKEMVTIKGADHGFGGENEEFLKKEAIQKTVLVFKKYL